MKRKLPLPILRAVDVTAAGRLKAILARAGPKSTGYRFVRAYLGMPIVDARALVVAELLAAGASVAETARALGISRATCYRLMKRRVDKSRHRPPWEPFGDQ